MSSRITFKLVRSEALVASKHQRLKPEFAGLILAFHMDVRWVGAIEAREK
jgi:hypothetical protein